MSFSVDCFELSYGNSFGCKNNHMFLGNVWILFSSFFLFSCVWLYDSQFALTFPLKSFGKVGSQFYFFFPGMLTFFSFQFSSLVIENIVWDKSGFSVWWLVFKPKQSSRQSSTLRFFQFETWSLSLLLHGTVHTFYTGPCWC